VTRHHIVTEYLYIDKELCTACGDCVEECPNQVLIIVGFKFIINHQHVKVTKHEDCTGCLSCVEACPEGAIKDRTTIRTCC
jgi:NAD-dependent dihydropyrimidine dehydrogenase PreA subunit